MLLSIIIPAYNEEKIIADTVSRIRLALEANIADASSWEIIVCDNNSSDRTAAEASATGAAVLFEPDNHISRARNTGAEYALGEWLLFIDADTYPQPGTIADLLDIIHSGDYLGCSSTIQVKGGPLWYRLNFEGNNLSMRLFKTCIGLFVMTRADAFWDLEGFSTDLYAFEDLDFVNRLKVYGHKKGLRFTVLHRHPVITSGRKGELYDRWEITKSSLIALWYLLSKQKTMGADRLPLWYDGRR
ncbi:MAG: glycosyltransferase [Anaerolineales bacterium]|nr:glycosyltransferase [Anaerolineales bacterium]